MMKTSIIKLYYLGLAALILVAVVQTIYVGSMHISSGREMAKLEKQQQSLMSQKQHLEQQLAAAGSLTNIAQFAAAAQFQPMVAPIPVTITSTMIVSR